MPSLTIYDLEPPDLSGSPAVVVTFHEAIDERLVDLFIVELPAFLEEFVIQLTEGDPMTTTPTRPEQPITVRTPRVVQTAVLLCASEASGGLLAVDMRENIGGGVGRFRWRLILIDGNRDAREPNAFTEEKPDALQCEAGLGRI